MDKLFLVLLCQSGYDLETRIKCQEVLRSTLRELHIYQTIKEKEKTYRELAETKLTKPGFWILSTAISSASTKKLYLSGHNVMGVDSITLKLGEESEVRFTWSF